MNLYCLFIVDFLIQNILAELPEFKSLLPLSLQKEMKEFATAQKNMKSEEKQRKKSEKEWKN